MNDENSLNSSTPLSTNDSSPAQSAGITRRSFIRRTGGALAISMIASNMFRVELLATDNDGDYDDETYPWTIQMTHTPMYNDYNTNGDGWFDQDGHWNYIDIKVTNNVPGGPPSDYACKDNSGKTSDSWSVSVTFDASTKNHDTGFTCASSLSGSGSAVLDPDGDGDELKVDGSTDGLSNRVGSTNGGILLLGTQVIVANAADKQSGSLTFKALAGRVVGTGGIQNTGTQTDASKELTWDANTLEPNTKDIKVHLESFSFSLVQVK